MFPDGSQLPYGEAHKAKNLGKPVINNHEETEALCPAAREELRPTRSRVSEHEAGPPHSSLLVGQALARLGTKHCAAS